MTPIAPRIITQDLTEFYTIQPQDAPKIKRIRAVYLYDANRHVHCCEWTPSYDCHYLYTDIELATPYDSDPGDLWEKYALEPVEDEYFHVPTMTPTVTLPDEEVDEDDGYEESFERVKEHYCGNPPIC